MQSLIIFTEFQYFSMPEGNRSIKCEWGKTLRIAQTSFMACILYKSMRPGPIESWIPPRAQHFCNRNGVTWLSRYGRGNSVHVLSAQSRCFVVYPNRQIITCRQLQNNAACEEWSVPHLWLPCDDYHAQVPPKSLPALRNLGNDRFSLLSSEENKMRVRWVFTLPSRWNNPQNTLRQIAW